MEGAIPSLGNSTASAVALKRGPNSHESWKPDSCKRADQLCKSSDAIDTTLGI